MQTDRKSYFDKVGADYAKTYAATSIHGYILTRRRELVASMLVQEKGGALLDIGCGAGSYIPVARSTGFTYIGVDSSESMVEGCRQLIGEAADARVLVATAASLPFPKSSFDLVLALGVYEYLDHAQHEVAFDELVRVVKPGGMVIGSFANYYSPFRTWYRCRGSQRTPEGLRFGEFKLSDIRRLLEARNMSVVKTVPLGINPFPPPLVDRLPRLTAICARVLGERGWPLGVLAMANLVVARASS